MQQRQGLNNNILHVLLPARTASDTSSLSVCRHIVSPILCDIKRLHYTFSIKSARCGRTIEGLFSSRRHTTMPNPIFRHKATRYASDSATKRLPSFAKAKEAKNQNSPITRPSGHWTSMINALLSYTKTGTQDAPANPASAEHSVHQEDPRSKTQEERRRKSRLALHFFKLCLMPTETLTSGQPRCLLFHADHATRQPYLTEPGEVTLPFA
jgi:hypothetical protein